MPTAGLQFRGLVQLGFRVRDKVRVGVRDRVGVRVSVSVIGSVHFTFCHICSPQKPASPHFTHNRNWMLLLGMSTCGTDRQADTIDAIDAVSAIKLKFHGTRFLVASSSDRSDSPDFLVTC